MTERPDGGEAESDERALKSRVRDALSAYYESRYGSDGLRTRYLLSLLAVVFVLVGGVLWLLHGFS